MAMRAGDFTASPTTIYDPATGNADGTGHTPFPNQTILPSRISPIAAQYLSFLPPPTTAALAQNYQGVTAQTKSIYQFALKLDYVIDSRNKMFFRYSYQ